MQNAKRKINNDRRLLFSNKKLTVIFFAGGGILYPPEATNNRRLSFGFNKTGEHLLHLNFPFSFTCATVA